MLKMMLINANVKVYIQDHLFCILIEYRRWVTS